MSYIIAAKKDGKINGITIDEPLKTENIPTVHLKKCTAKKIKISNNKMRYCEKKMAQAYKGSNNSSRWCPEKKLCITEHAKMKMLIKEEN